METKHTPGPWEKSDGGWIEAADSTIDVVAYESCGSHAAEWPNPADYILAVAAPDLLAALEAVLVSVRLSISSGKPFVEGLGTTALANAAIAKATGKCCDV